MANELDRVRISAAELRADVSNSVNSELQEEDQQEHQGHQQHRRREGKRPDLQRYQPAAGHGRRHRDSEEGETSGSGLCDDNIALLSEHNPPQSSEKMAISDTVSDMKECMSGGMGTNQSDDARLRGDGSNAQHSRNNSSAQAKTKELHEKDFVENEREPQELVGSAKQTKKTRKPDREFYQPGSRRNTQGKDCGTSKQQDKPPPRKHLQKSEPVSQSRTGENEGNTMLLKNGGKNNLRKFHNGKLSKMSDASQKQGSTHEEKPPLPSQTSLEKLTSKMDKLSVKGKAKVSSVSQDDDEVVCRKWETNTNKSSQGGGTKDDEDKVVKKGERGNRRIRGGEKEKERNLDSRRGEAEVGSGAKNDQKTTEKGRGTRPPDIGRENKPGKTKEMKQVTGRENRRGKGDSNNNRSQENEKGNKMDRNVDGLVERRNKSNVKITTPTSKRYSKSDIRRSRNRTYSSSSASSAASLDGPGPGVDGQSIKWPRSNPRHNDKEKTVESRGGRRGDSHNWSTNGESSTESLDGSEMSDIAEDKRRRRRDCEQQLSTDRLRGERKRPKGCSSASRGILKVSSERQSGTSSCDDAQRCKQGLSPRGRGGGILVLPAHTDICDSPELGQRLLFGRSRGGTPSRGRGGRGGGVRRLWDPNNPDQKPALTNAPSSQHSYLQQPTYLHTGTGYGQLHFLDTDDEVAGSPPLPLGEYFQSQQQQAAAMTYYKFQNSDNPYSYPVPTSNTQNPNSISNQRYPYPYHMGPYQMSHPNGMYSGTNVGQFSDGYRGTGYSHPGATGVLTFEEVEQHARGELGRLLRAADTQEHQLSNLLSRDHLSADGLDRMAQLRAELLVLYEQAILTDIEFSDTQSVDQALWKNVFYQVIERFRQLLKDSASDNMASMRNMLLTLLDEGAVFFDALLQKLQTVYHFKLEDYMDGMAIRTRPLSKTVKYALISAQRCMICQGDIARYREQASDSNNYGKARSWYLKAQQIAPKNGRPYNQLALLAVYTKRKLDAVYYYMRSLAASNPILTAKESLMSLFEEAKRKAEQLDRRRRQEHEGGSTGPAVRGKRREEEERARVEIWIRPSGSTATASSHRGGGESNRDSEHDGELGHLSVSDLNKRFILSFLHAHGKLFTKVGMESLPGVASHVLQEFRTLLQHGPSLLGSTHLLQIITINMFTIYNAHSRGEEGEIRSVLQEQSTALGLGMFALLVQRCTELLRDIPTVAITNEEEDKQDELEGMVKVSTFPLNLKELLPSIKVWSDWMLGHPNHWNPPPCSLDSSPDVWQCLADLCNLLAHVDHGEVPLYKADTDEVQRDEELAVLLLKEDRLLAGFVPLLAAPQEPCYIDRHTDMAIAADCKRVIVLKYFLEALCGQEEPLLAFKGGKYITVATPSLNHSKERNSRQDFFTEEEQGDDVLVEGESSPSASEGEEDVEEAGESDSDIRELRARRHALANKLAQQQRRRDKIQEVLQTGGVLELEVQPLFLVPDTNGFIDHLEGLKKLLQCGTYIIVVPLVVITELDGLAKGQDNFAGGAGLCGRSTGSRGNSNISVAHLRAVQEKARLAVAFLEKGFEAREQCLRALTSRGNQLESIAFRSEDTSGQQGNNDDVILSCCLHYCKEKAKDFMPNQRGGIVRLRREVVLLTDDRNLRVKALTRNVPVRDIPAFLSWAKVG